MDVRDDGIRGSSARPCTCRPSSFGSAGQRGRAGRHLGPGRQSCSSWSPGASRSMGTGSPNFCTSIADRRSAVDATALPGRAGGARGRGDQVPAEGSRAALPQRRGASGDRTWSDSSPAGRRSASSTSSGSFARSAASGRRRRSRRLVDRSGQAQRGARRLLRRASEPPPSLKVPETLRERHLAPWEPPVLLEDISPPTAARMGQARIAAGVGLLLAIVIGVLVLVTRGSASSMSAPSTAASPMPEVALRSRRYRSPPSRWTPPSPPATGTPTASENGSTAVAAPSASTGSAAVPIALRPTPSSSAPVPGARAPGPAPKPSPRPVDDYSQFGERR